MAKIEALSPETLETFKSYCNQYRLDHDESFLSPQDLASFQLGEDNPTWLALDQDQVVGVLSLMITPYYRAASKVRVRIFHCATGNPSHYDALLQKAIGHPTEVDKMELFMPDQKTHVQDILRDLGWRYVRTSFVMVRKESGSATASFPRGFRLKPLEVGKDEPAYAQVRNQAFGAVQGNDTPITVDMVTQLLEAEDLLPQGMQILWEGDQAVGVIRMLAEEDETGKYGFVAPLAIAPAYQGRGLGLALLQVGIALGAKAGYPDTMLVVNGENEKALTLYKKAGFTLDMSVSCFHFPL